jgi:hypothetical protein
MPRIFQPGRIAQRQPVWLRLMALMCILLIGIASTAEICHTHSVALATSKNSGQNVPGSNVPGSNVPGPDHCPLCVAMHTALPTTATASFEPVLQAQPVALKLAAEVWALQWSYELFSRPPPALLSLA